MGHTPGPWRAVGTEIVWLDCPDDQCVVADVLSEDYAANARLIAAAPELLAVCQAMAGDLQSLLDAGDFSGMSDAEMFGVMLRSLNAAIAKAEGRSE